ncbi:MAG: RloB family protein [Phycisphaerae bacterium]
MARRARGRRRRAPRKYSPRLLLYCEGKATEYEYLARLNSEYKRSQGPVLAPKRGKGTDAISVVRRAIHEGMGDENYSEDDGDRVYVVLDVEPHDQSKVAALRQALSLAEAKGVSVLLSNPAFEYWLLCHVLPANRLTKQIPSAKDADVLLQKELGYGKAQFHANPCLFEQLIEKVKEAVENASQVHLGHHQGTTDIAKANPCTTVYRLVGYITGQYKELP